MTKVLQWIGKLMVGTILVTGITVFITWTTVSSYIDKLLKTYHLEAIQPGFADMLGGALGSLTGGTGGDAAIEPQEEPVKREDSAVSPETVPNSPTPGPTMGQDENPTPGNSPNNGSSPEPSTDGKKDPVQVQSQSGGLNAAGSGVVLSAEEIMERKDQLSDETKQEILALLVDKLPEEEMQQLTALLEGGLTAEELQEMETALKSYLDGNEYANLLHMINKYE